MKIGVFGDSFADQNLKGKGAWFDYLRADSISVYGQPGSSISFSALKILEEHQHFDLIIWCVTNPPRASKPIPMRDSGEYAWLHVNCVGWNLINPVGQENLATLLSKNEIKSLADLAKTFIVEFEENSIINIEGKAIVEYVANRVPNLITIPCFSYLYQTTGLDNISLKEVAHLFPDYEYYQIFEEFIDIRACHLTEENNQILAQEINSNLTPGMLKLDIDRFVEFHGNIDSILLKKKK